MFSRRNFSKPGTRAVKSSEEREMEKIAELRHQLAQKRKLAEESKKKLESGESSGPMRSEHKVTKTMEFHFATDERIKTHSMETRNDANKSSNFASSLRSHPPSPVSSAKHGKHTSSSVVSFLPNTISVSHYKLHLKIIMSSVMHR